MKRTSLSLLIACVVLLVVGFFVGKYAIEHRIGYDVLEDSAQSLDLSNRGLSSVPSSVFEMTELTSLDVSRNTLSGALPGEIRFLQNLEMLDASENAMTGVPAEIGQLLELRYLDLSNNALTGLPNELGNLSSLLRLDLRGNAVSAQDLEGIRAMLPQAEIFVD